jgi:hypothetical protein
MFIVSRYFFKTLMFFLSQPGLDPNFDMTVAHDILEQFSSITDKFHNELIVRGQCCACS